MADGGIDWTAIIIASIAAVSGSFAAVQSRLNQRSIKENTTATRKVEHDIRTDSAMTIGQHMEALRGELARIAESKVSADAELAAAALAAVARLVNTTPPLESQAEVVADDLVTKAQQTADRLKGGQ